MFGTSSSKFLPVYPKIDAKKDLLMNLSEKKVNEFLYQLEKTGFYEWSLFSPTSVHCDIRNCISTEMQVLTRFGTNVRRISMNSKRKHILMKSDIVHKRMAKIKNLVEKYFPTEQLRCGLGNSESIKEQCFSNEINWKKISKENM